MTKRIFNRFNGLWFTAAACIIALNAWLSSSALAASAKEIDTGVDESIVKFEKEVKNGKNFLDSSKGILVFPRVLKGGAGFGGEYGEGVDGSVSLVTLGAGGSIDTNNLKDPIVGFVLGQKGLMYNLSFEGTKFSKKKKE